MNHVPSFSDRCKSSSPAWGHLGRTEMRAVHMIATGRILTHGAWQALDARLEAHAVQLRRTATVHAGNHGRVWCDGIAVRTYRRLRALQQQAQALAQVALLLADTGVN